MDIISKTIHLMPEVSRREFMAGLAAAVTVAVVPLPADSFLKAHEDFQDWGESIPISPEVKFGTKEYEYIWDFLGRRAVQMLPKGAPFDIRMRLAGDYGRNCGMAWYSHTGMSIKPRALEWTSFMEDGTKVRDRWSRRHISKPDFVPELGVYMVGQYLT